MGENRNKETDWKLSKQAKTEPRLLRQKKKMKPTYRQETGGVQLYKKKSIFQETDQDCRHKLTIVSVTAMYINKARKYNIQGENRVAPQ